MTVIGLMCDGQHKQMQNYLREQKGSITNFSIIEEITSFLYEYTKRRLITSDILPLITEAFQALIELCSGNVENSEAILQQQILPIINYYLQIDITNINFNVDETEEKKCSQSDLKEKSVRLRCDVLKLKAAVVELLEVMLEKVSSETERLTFQIAEGLDVTALQYSMVDFLILKDDEDLKEKKSDDNAQRALFKTYSVISHLASSGANTASQFSK